MYFWILHDKAAASGETRWFSLSSFFLYALTSLMACFTQHDGSAAHLSVARSLHKAGLKSLEKPHLCLWKGLILSVSIRGNTHGALCTSL